MGNASVQKNFPEPVRFSRRHLLKAVAIAAGAMSVSIPQNAHAQFGGHGGCGDGDGDGDDQWCCFLRGTQIRGVTDYRAIETLTAGERLPTRFSGMAAIRKIITYTVSRDEAGNWPEDCRPVRICAGALGENIPRRDLLLTNSHAVFLDGVLVPIGDLANGKTIFFDDMIGGLDTLEYIHVEFDAHDVIDAEGALCKSRRDDAMEACAPIVTFNGERSRLYSHLRSAIAPLVDCRQPLDRIRDGLEARAGL